MNSEDEDYSHKEEDNLNEVSSNNYSDWDGSDKEEDIDSSIYMESEN